MLSQLLLTVIEFLTNICHSKVLHSQRHVANIFALEKSDSPVASIM